MCDFDQFCNLLIIFCGLNFLIMFCHPLEILVLMSTSGHFKQSGMWSLNSYVSRVFSHSIVYDLINHRANYAFLGKDGVIMPQ